ncbi:MAG TPA: PaaI family thioesterase [Candidatus Binatia bacterium]|nr:PaaI family thioesterase [Candidatus Binatia bacterium]
MPGSPGPAEQSLQERLAPRSRCFGCGPANEGGLHLRSFVDADGSTLVAEWTARPEHEAFGGVVNGGILATLLDCHANWTAVRHLMERERRHHPPDCVTAELTVRFLRPTPSRTPIRLRARVVEASGRSVTVEATVEADGTTTVTARGRFVAVGPEHPAFGRWEGDAPPTGT